MKKNSIDSIDKGKYRSIMKLNNSPYLAPAVFFGVFCALIILFRDFIFSNLVFHSGDFVQSGLFFRSFLVNYVLNNGAIPQWDPYLYGGMPFVDAFHSDIFYPLSVLKYIGPIFRNVCYIIIAHIYVSGIFTYFCARQFKLSKVASLFTGIIYMFSSNLISLVGPLHDGKIFAITLFPLAMLFLERGFEKKPYLNFSILGLIIGVIVLTPHPQLAYFTLWSLALYTVYKLIVGYIDKRSLAFSFKHGILVVYAVAIGLLVSAIQIYPSFYYTKKYSPRSDTKKGWEWATSWSLHEEEAFSLVVPEFAGVNTSNAQTYYWGKNPFKDNAEGIGIIALFLALIAAIYVRRKEAYFLIGLAALALIYGLGATTPIFKLFFLLVPLIKSLRAPSMIMFLFVFPVAILAGMGLQFILDLKEKDNVKTAKHLDKILIATPGLLFVIAFLFSVAGNGVLKLWTSLFYKDAALTMVQRGVSKFDVALMNLGAIQSGAWYSFLFIFIAATCIWLYRKNKVGAAVIIVLLLLPVINGVRFNSRFINLFDHRPYTQSNPVNDYLKRDNSKYRVHDFTNSSVLNLPFYGVELVTGYHGNQLKWYDQLIGGPSQRNIANPRLLNLVGAKYLIIPPNQKMPENYFGEKILKSILNFDKGLLVENDNAFPRAFLAQSFKKYDNIESVIAEVTTGKENLAEVVLLEEDPDIILPDSAIKSDSAWIISHQPDSVIVGINSVENNILILTDNYYDAWNAYIDDKPAKIMRAYGSFRAVAIPAGTEKVSFRYESKRYKTAKMLTWTAIVYLIILFGSYSIIPLVRRRSQKQSTV